MSTYAFNISKPKLILISMFILFPKLQYMNNFGNTTYTSFSFNCLKDYLLFPLECLSQLQNLYFAYSNYANNRFKGEYEFVYLRHNLKLLHCTSWNWYWYEYIKYVSQNCRCTLHIILFQVRLNTLDTFSVFFHWSLKYHVTKLFFKILRFIVQYLEIILQLSNVWRFKCSAVSISLY